MEKQLRQDASAAEAKMLTWNCGYCEGSICTPTNAVTATLNTADSTLTISGMGAMANGFFSLWNGAKTVVINDDVTSIGNDAFANCSGLTEFVVSNDNTAYASADGVLFNKNKTILLQCPTKKTGAYTIPNTVTHIGDFAFRCCEGLTSVTIGNAVIHIGIFAFFDCNGLTHVTCLAATPPTLGVNNFFTLESATTLYVPADAVSAYQNDSDWNRAFDKILAIGSATKDDRDGM